MPMTSVGRTASPAKSRCSTQSMPLSLGERAQPGSTSDGMPSIWPRQIRLPGSTGIPKWSITPPARTMPAGPDIAPVHHRRGARDQQHLRARPPEPGERVGDRPGVSWRQRSGGSMVPQSPSTRSRVASTVPSSTFSFRPGSSVSTSPTLSGWKGCRASSGCSCRASAVATSSTAPGTAKGMTLMVATISRARTGTKLGKVAEGEGFVERG